MIGTQLVCRQVDDGRMVEISDEEGTVEVNIVPARVCFGKPTLSQIVVV